MKYTPMIEQYLKIKKEYQDMFLFYRLGDFYEMFFEDAVRASKILEITLTARDGGAEKIPMCGVPFHSSAGYIDTLVNNGYKVAICEQVSEPGQGKIVERKVVQVITPGTYMNYKNYDENNFLGSAYIKDNNIYFAFCDIMTGDSRCTILKTMEDLQDEVLKNNIKEVISIEGQKLDISAYITEVQESDNLSKDKGFTYFQSTSEADYANNLNQAAGSYNLIFGVGFALHNAVEEAAKEHSDKNYVLIDDVIKDQKNVASVTFADNEAAYLAGVAAAKTTKTKQVGFVGGMESEVISRFAAGFKAGVESVDPSIKVQVDYAGSFGDAAKGKTIAAAQYAAGADVIYQAAGGTGAGVFSEAKSLNESKNEDEKVWVIGVDRDQVDEGKYTSKDGKEANFVLASTLKQVGTTVQDISNKTEKGEFPGGQVIVYSLKDKGVDLAVTNLSEEGKKAVEDAKAKILDGSIKVPEK